MNCEAYIAYYWNGQINLYPNNIEPSLLTDIFKDLPSGESYDTSDWLAIKRKDEMVYYAFIVTLAGEPQDRLCLMIGLNNLLITDILALDSFMRHTLRDLAQRCRIARYDTGRGVYTRLGADGSVAKLPEAQAILRDRFNERFDGCGTRPGAHDYAASPGIDMYAMLPDGRTRYVTSPSSRQPLSLARSIEAGNTIMIQSRREETATRPDPDSPTPPKPQTHNNPATTIGGAILGFLIMETLAWFLIQLSNMEHPDFWIPGEGPWDPAAGAFHLRPIAIGFIAGLCIMYLGRRFGSFLKAATVTLVQLLILYLAYIGFVIDSYYLSYFSFMYILFSICCGMACCKAITDRRQDKGRIDTQTRNRGYISGLALTTAWSVLSIYTIWALPYSYSNFALFQWLVPCLCGFVAGRYRQRNVWFYRSSLACSALAAAIFYSKSEHLVVVPAMLFGSFAMTTALLMDLFTKTDKTNPAQQPTAYNPE